MNTALDEHLPRRLVDVLAALGRDVDTVPEEQIMYVSETVAR